VTSAGFYSAVLGLALPCAEKILREAAFRAPCDGFAMENEPFRPPLACWSWPFEHFYTPRDDCSPPSEDFTGLQHQSTHCVL
jgi:hypothetical protein